MSRRITIAIVGMVIGTLLLAGLGTIVASRVGGKAQELNVLRARATEIAGLVPNLNRATDAPVADSPARAELRADLIAVLDLSGVTQLRITRAGELVGDRPAWIPNRAFDLDALRNGETLSGSRANRLWAAAARQNTNGGHTVAVVTATRGAIIAPTIRWLALSAAAAMIVGVGVSVLLGQRLARPVRDAVTATRRIAAGDLDARLPEPAATSGSDELGDLAGSINQMAGELQRSRALEHQFLMSVSHDLRTPLTSIRGYAEAVADGVADPAHSAAVIIAESQRLERLVSDLLDLAKLDARQFSFRMADTTLAPIIAAAAAAIAPEAAAARLEVRTATDADATVRVDADRLTQAVGNLSANSLRYARTAVWIRTRLQTGASGEPGIAVDVADDGPGIATEDITHIFERLYQARSEVERRESGSGLGLAIVKELVEAMGGTITVSSAPGAGSTFTLWLPVAR